MPLRACDIELRNSIDGRLGILADTMRENYYMVILALVLLGLTIFIVYLFVDNIVNIVKTYKRFSRGPEAEVNVNTTLDKPKDDIQLEIKEMAMAVSGDDYKPIEDNEDSSTMATQDEAIQNKIAALKNIYAEYNKQITQHSQDVRKTDPEDVIDEKILSKEDDLYR